MGLRMVRKALIALGVAAGMFVLIRAHGVPAQGADARPATAPVSVEVRANEAFGAGQYSIALPLLQKLAADQKDPQRLAAIEEQIRVCQKNLTNPQVAAADNSPTAAPAAKPQANANPDPTQNMLTGNGNPNATSTPDPPMDAKHRIPHPTPKPDETIDLAIKELGNFEYDTEHGSPIPDDVKHLNGVKLRTHGFMIAIDQADSITEFALVPSLLGCCNFGSAPQIQHTIIVHCPKGKAVSFYGDEIVVEGTLTVQEKKDDGYVVSLFEMEAGSVKPMGM